MVFQIPQNALAICPLNKCKIPFFCLWDFNCHEKWQMSTQIKVKFICKKFLWSHFLSFVINCSSCNLNDQIYLNYMSRRIFLQSFVLQSWANHSPTWLQCKKLHKKKIISTILLLRSDWLAIRLCFDKHTCELKINILLRAKQQPRRGNPRFQMQNNSTTNSK